MKKLLATCAVLLLGLSVSNILAQSEPANKNLLDPAAFEVNTDNTIVRTITPIPITQGKTYTFSMPSSLEGVHLKLYPEGSNDSYVDEKKSDPDTVCTAPLDKRICTFTAETDSLSFEMSGGIIVRTFNVYEFDDFQLEEGNVATDYVPYEALETTPPVFGGDALLVIGYNEPTLTQTLIDTHITATDEIDGDLSDSIEVLSDTYTGSKDTLGTYPIELYVEDSSGNGATFTLNVKVVDTQDPVIDGVTNLTMNVDSPKDVDTIITSNAAFSDAYDGVITGYTVLQNTYTGNETVLGDSLIEFEISDASGNKATHTFAITTLDTESPLISGPETVSINQSDPETVEALFALYSVSDNHTSSGAITFTIDSHTLPSSLGSGEYAMTLSALDASGNETLKTIPVTIIDDVAPVIRNYSYIKESYQSTFDLAAYLANMEVSDNDSLLSSEDVSVSENLYQQGVVGTYSLRFEVRDKASNVSTHALTIEVVDDIAPVFTFTDTIQTSVNTVLNETQLNALIVESDNLTNFDAIDYQVVDDTYTDNAASEGSYVYTVEYMNHKGDTVTSSIDIEVLKISDPIEEDKDSPIPWLVLPASVIVLAAFVIVKKRK